MAFSLNFAARARTALNALAVVRATGAALGPSPLRLFGERQLAQPTLQIIRTATKKAQSSKTHNKDSRGRRLGMKKSDGQDVDVGQIIFRQRGTKFFPGENAGIGRDHTIFALERGVVRYYRDPFHPTRKLIGIALSRDEKLPTPHFSPRRRVFNRFELEDPEEVAAEKARVSRKEYYGRLAREKVVAEKKAKTEASA
ncbi:mitochondrial 54S ribosomal protein bL27m [Dipodascopsis tothii]|uniref:mitochondrial 54S ribosomal protein bL27m n=1 Tax=Dipodascopsis tothii TaxID=44089 RepID=UPI0034CD65AB